MHAVKLLQDVEVGIRRMLALEEDLKSRLQVGAERTKELKEQRCVCI